MAPPPLTLTHPWLFAAACVLALAAVAVAFRRRPAVTRTTSVLTAVALALLPLAAGGLTWQRRASAEVVVMLDLSASTRGATYRDRATLGNRLRQLIGDTPYRLAYFAATATDARPAGNPLPDLPGDRTVFAPPAARAVVLFSDGRFDLPAAAPPTFVVADPALDLPGDAAVTRLEARGPDLAATTTAPDAPPAPSARTVAIENQPTPLQPGRLTVTRPLRPGETVATAQISPGDRWPENDVLSLPLAPPSRAQRWWVSAGRPAPGPDWTTLKPADLPTSSTAWLAPAVVALDNVPAADLSPAQFRAVMQYVRDLGGTLILGGGNRAFAPGDYTGTPLDTLSPLATSPPQPAVHWILLADASGSMAQSAGIAGAAATRWQAAASALTRLLPALPPDDLVSAGSFAADLTWWTPTAKPAREVAALPLPPAAVSPTGPTNLESALDRVARESAGTLASELLVISDADTTIARPDDLAARLAARKVRLHLLAIGAPADARSLDALARLTAATGGTLRRQLDPAAWPAEARQLLQTAWPKRLSDTPTPVSFTGDLAPLPARPAAPWNRTWLKKDASELATTQAGDDRLPMAARWTVGAAGDVAAFAFAPTRDEVTALAARIAKPPRDPRFTVTWDAADRLTVRVDARDRDSYLNGLPLRLELSPADGPGATSVHAVPQTAPGRYELTLPAPRERRFATLRHNNSLLDRTAVPARYAPEFDTIGNDYDATRALAARTGGRVIDPAWTKPLELPFPPRAIPLAPWLALTAAAALSVGLARWRYG
jgi:hypothetical protein